MITAAFARTLFGACLLTVALTGIPVGAASLELPMPGAFAVEGLGAEPQDADFESADLEDSEAELDALALEQVGEAGEESDADAAEPEVGLVRSSVAYDPFGADGEMTPCADGGEEKAAEKTEIKIKPSITDATSPRDGSKRLFYVIRKEDGAFKVIDRVLIGQERTYTQPGVYAIVGVYSLTYTTSRNDGKYPGKRTRYAVTETRMSPAPAIQKTFAAGSHEWRPNLGHSDSWKDKPTTKEEELGPVNE